MQIGRYLIQRELAVGGMAEVFLARLPGPEHFTKPVVLKRLRPRFRDDAQVARMFLDEARMAARFDHPNLIQVYELAMLDGAYCIIMEYLRGFDLSDVLSHCIQSQQKLSVATACFLVARAADGLHYAHNLKDDRGQPLDLVHRDVSPSNLIVTESGTLKVVDFGIASPASPDRVLGKPSYMSPEQERNVALDRRSDVFSLGVVFFELLTSRRLFGTDGIAKNADAILRGIESEDISRPVKDILAKSLDVAREARFRDADELSRRIDDYLVETENRVRPSEVFDELRHVMAGSESPTDLVRDSTTHFRTAPSPRRRKRGPVLLMGLVGVGLLSGVSFLNTPSGETVTDVPADEPEAVVAPAEPRDEDRRPSIPPPGSTVDQQSTVDREVVETPKPSPKPRLRRPKSVTARITSEPRVDIYWQGRFMGRTPLSFSLPTGKHSLLASSKELGLRREFLINASTTGKNERALVFDKGRVAFLAKPWAQVSIDGEPVGTTPMMPVSLYEGTHRVTLFNPDTGVRRDVTVKIKPGQLTTVQEVLE